MGSIAFVPAFCAAQRTMKYLTIPVYIGVLAGSALSGCGTAPTCDALASKLVAVGGHVEILSVMKSEELEQTCTTRGWLDDAANAEYASCVLAAKDASAFDACGARNLGKLLGS